MIDRRSFIKSGIAATGTASLLAGCSGGNGGGGGDTPEVRLTSFPGHTDGVIHTYIERNGILEDNMNEAGYDFTMQNPFEDISIFVSDQSAQVNMGSLEAARLAVRQEVDLAICGHINSIFYSSFVREGSDLDPEVSGGIENSWNIVAEEDRRVGIISWGLGNIPGEQVLLQSQYGLSLQEEGGDFSNVVTADPAAIPNLLVNGDIDVGMMAPTFSPPGPLYEGEITPMYILSDKMIRDGFGIPHLDGPVFKQSFVDDHPDAVRAYLDALDEAMQWLYESGMDEIPTDEELRSNMNAPNPELSRFQLQWLTAWKTGNEVADANGDPVVTPEHPTLYDGSYLSDDWIEQNRNYVNNAGENGLIAEEWSEDMWGDRIEYVTF